MEDHQTNQCSDRLVFCPNQCNGCEGRNMAKDIQNHENIYCKKLKCSFDGCGFLGTMEEQMKHKEQCPERIVPCPNETNGCNVDDLKDKEMPNHLKNHCQCHKCPKSSDGCDWMGKKKEEEHHVEKQCLYKNYQNCEFCQVLIQRTEFPNHLKKDCTYLSEKVMCPFCNNYFVRKNMNEHKHGFINKKNCFQLAIEKENLEFLISLLKWNVNLEMDLKEAQKSLHLALKNGNIQVAFFILANIMLGMSQPQEMYSPDIFDLEIGAKFMVPAFTVPGNLIWYHLFWKSSEKGHDLFVQCLVESASIYFDIKRLDGQMTTALYLASKKRNTICHWNESRQKKFEKQVRKTFGLLKGSSRIMLGFDI